MPGNKLSAKVEDIRIPFGEVVKITLLKKWQLRSQERILKDRIRALAGVVVNFFYRSYLSSICPEDFL